MSARGGPVATPVAKANGPDNCQWLSGLLPSVSAQSSRLLSSNLHRTAMCTSHVTPRRRLPVVPKTPDEGGSCLAVLATDVAVVIQPRRGPFPVRGRRSRD